MQAVALGRRHERERDAGVAAGRLDDRAAGRQQAAALGVLDHGDRDAVLDAAARVARLELGQQARAAGVDAQQLARAAWRRSSAAIPRATPRLAHPCCRASTSFFAPSVAERQQRQDRRHREGADDVVLVVEDLHLQRHGVGLAADVARHDRHRAELAHRARVAQHDAVEQAPADLGQRHPEQDLPAARAQRQRRLLLVVAAVLHDRQHLARDEREGDERRRQDDAGHREDDVDVVRLEPRAEDAARARAAARRSGPRSPATRGTADR